MFNIGSSLHEARTRQNLDLEEMERRTKVRAKYLRLLEDERFDQLPGHAYTKGFLQVYASALGLDGRLYVEEYNSRYVAGDEEGGAAPRLPRAAPIRQRGRRDRRESRGAGIALAAILLVTALVIAAWRFGGPEDEKVPGLVPQSTGTAAQAANARGKVRMVVRATEGSTWMEVRAATPAGKLLYSGTLEQGQRSRRFEGRLLQLALAEPDNVVVRVNGNRVDLPAGTTFVVSAQRIARATS